jgi:hypothetical protein
VNLILSDAGNKLSHTQLASAECNRIAPLAARRPETSTITASRDRM